MELNWRKLKNSQHEHNNLREGHTITYIRKLDSLLLYGGISNPKYNEVYLYSIADNLWKLQPTTGRKPTARSHHVALYDQQLDIYIVNGGEAQKGRSLDDFQVLFLKNWQWKKIFLLNISPARHYHTLTDLKNQEKAKILFGGLGLPKNVLYNDIWILKNLPSTVNNNSQEINGCVYDLVYTKGEVPPPRKGHQAEVLNKTLFILGGQARETQNLFTVYSLSLQSFNWRKVDLKNKTIQQRAHFSSCLRMDEIIIFGGIDKEKNVTAQMFKVCLNGNKLVDIKLSNTPTSRYNHSLTVATSNEQFKAYLLGGQQLTYRSFDIYQLADTQQEEFNERKQIKSIRHNKDLSQYIENLEMKLMKAKHEKLKLQKQLKEESQETKRKVPETSANTPSIQVLLTMIKNEQFLSQEIIKKNNTLERLLRKMQEYIYHLDQNYNTYGEEDESIERVKQSHIHSCLKLKDSYILIDKHYKRNLNQINQTRNQVIQYNNGFEGFMETEVDEDN